MYYARELPTGTVIGTEAASPAAPDGNTVLNIA